MIDTKTFNEIAKNINLKQLCGVTNIKQINNGKSPENVDLMDISAKKLMVGLKKLVVCQKIYYQKYAQAFDFYLATHYIAVYLKLILVKILENKKMSGLTYDEIVRHYKDELDRLQQDIGFIDEQRNGLNKRRTDLIKKYRTVAEEYKLMVGVVKKIKPDIKGEDIVNRALFFSDNSMDLMLKDLKGKLSATEALKKLFDQYPDELFEATKLRDQIEWLGDNKLLTNNSDNLQWTTHSSLKVLVRKKYIERIEQDGKTYYKKRQP